MTEQRQNVRDQEPAERRPIQFGEDPGGASLAVREDQTFWTERQSAALRAIGIQGAPAGDLLNFLHYAVKTGLDPFTKQIYMIKRRVKQDGRYVDKWTIQVGIDGFRVIRDRAARKQGVEVSYEDTIWFDDDGSEHEVWLEKHPPAACKLVILKVLPDGTQLRYPAVIRFDAYCPRDQEGRPTGQWDRQGDHMIEKCAEAAALRRGFPQDLGSLYAEEELQQDEDGVSRSPVRPARRQTIRSMTATPGRPRRSRSRSEPEDAAAHLSSMMANNGLDTEEQADDRALLLRALASDPAGELISDRPVTEAEVSRALTRYRELMDEWAGAGMDPVEATASMIAATRAEAESEAPADEGEGGVGSES